MKSDNCKTKVFLPMDNQYYLDALETLKAYPDALRLLDQLHDELRLALRDERVTEAVLKAFATASDFQIQLAVRSRTAIELAAHWDAQRDLLHTRTTETLAQLTLQVS